MFHHVDPIETEISLDYLPSLHISAIFAKFLVALILLITAVAGRLVNLFVTCNLAATFAGGQRAASGNNRSGSSSDSSSSGSGSSGSKNGSGSSSTPSCQSTVHLPCLVYL